VSGQHRRDQLWGEREVVVIPGKDPKTFWRMPTDLKTWTEDMRYGMGLVDGRLVAWQAEPPGPVQ
jgi:hypothetical protein